MKHSQCIVLSHGSARRYWKHAGSPHCPAPTPESARAFKAARIDRALCSEALSECAPWLNSPIEVLVQGDENRRIVTDAKVHSLSCDVPERSLARLSASVLVVSPELSFAQMGSVFTVPQLAAYGTELCSSYCLDPLTRRLEERKKPCTTPSLLRSYLKKAGKVSGCSRALAALKWVFAGAESPMEIKTAMLLCLPLRFGGYGLPAPQLNRTIYPGRAAHVVGQGEFRPDMSWPDFKIAVEYDGKESHEDAHRDKRRINDLEHLGWKVFVATSADFATAASSDRYAIKVATAIGRRVRKGATWPKDNAALRCSLGIDWVEMMDNQP